MTVELPPKPTKATKPTRKELLREFFLNATLIALINELGRESARLERAVAVANVPGAGRYPLRNFS